MVEDMWVALLSTKASQYFADLLVSYFDAVKFIPVERKSFGDGERYYRIGVEDRTEFMRRNAIVVGSIHSDDDIMDLYRLGHVDAVEQAQLGINEWLNRPRTLVLIEWPERLEQVPRGLWVEIRVGESGREVRISNDQ